MAFRERCFASYERNVPGDWIDLEFSTAVVYQRVSSGYFLARRASGGFDCKHQFLLAPVSRSNSNRVGELDIGRRADGTNEIVFF
jgi:hypothetical protein